MNTRGRRTGAAVAATGLVLAMTAGLGGAAAAPAGHEGGAGSAAATAGGSAVTLITGDEVLLDAHGAVSAVVRAQGREHIPIRVFERDGATLVVPWDAQSLIDDGTVDEGLFNVTELSQEAYGAFAGLPVIVAYDEGSRSMARTLRADTGVEVRDSFDALEADALTLSEEHAAPLWETLTQGPGEDGMSLSAAPGVRTVSLDRVRQATLDNSAGQVGADQAWEAGYDGSGVTIAVLDTGIAADHGDFEDKVRAEADFTDDNTEGDSDGHGTHVASTAAGSGDRSDGAFRGIAPGADLLAGKVLGEFGGLDSWIIAGMEWAVEEGADIVNMSLGGPARQGNDPLVEAVDALSEEHGTLFVIAAGNSGPAAGTVGSPGVARSALTIGAVDDEDAVADFSSAGPSPVDGSLKPDMSAPGVEIAAAAAAGSGVELTGTPVADGYAAISGTSMAAPHVAGAAALLLQRHPDLTGEQLKAALVGSAADVGGAPVRLGTGRLDIPRALDQTLTADSNTLDFGAVAPPPGDADPITREITYHNRGEADLDLDLDLSTTAPGGGGAPEGLFALSAETVTVPAGGTATFEVVADPAALAASGDGHYGLVVTGTSGDQQVRTAGTLALEPEQHDVTIEITGRDGNPAEGARAFVVSPDAGFNALSASGTVTGQVPAGDYLIEVVAPDPYAGAAEGGSVEWAVAPRLTIDGATTLEVDLREAERLDFTAPDPDAELRELATTYDSPGVSGWMWYFGAPPDGVNSLSIAEPPADDPFQVSLLSHHAGPDGQQYLGHRVLEGTFPTGLVNHPAASDMAHVAATVGTRADGAEGWAGAAPEAFGLGIGTAVGLPGTADFWLQPGTPWRLSSTQYGADGASVQQVMYPPEEFPAGETSERILNAGVFGPAYPNGAAFFREGNLLFADLSLSTPGTGESGWAELGPGSTRVYRDGELVRDLAVSTAGLAFGLPEGEAEFRIVSAASRADLGYTDTSTEVTVDHTFTSATTDAYEPVAGPLAVRYSPALAADSTAPAGEGFAVPVAVEGGTAASLTVETSTDGGESWTTVHDGAGDVSEVVVDNPAADGSVSLRATAVDADGNRTVQTVIDAYHTR
ncbi:S8 family serine peptidase [Streptomyces sp. MP131-18]|uniref:S8 family serine peptidase n=1 Tax=Streptomyces sp. MP131-18 TaxID=1857892 RepID=UPI0009D51D0A|nr:S8 family serine peptidase [Streptomyces sp. MP131-18]ONK14574.1 Serine protease AprX [Streptomyces sp. MP131-18]